MTEKLKPRAPVKGSAYRLAHTLPRTLYESLERFTGNKSIKKALSETFVEAVKIVKEVRCRERPL